MTAKQYVCHAVCRGQYQAYGSILLRYNSLHLSSVSRLASMDQAIHQLNVGHYTLDVKVTQMLERISRLDNKLTEMEDSLQQVSHCCKENRKEIGRLEGLLMC